MRDKRGRERRISRCLRLHRKPYSKSNITDEPSREPFLNSLFATLILVAILTVLVVYYIGHATGDLSSLVPIKVSID